MISLSGRFDFFVPGRPVPQGSKTAFVSKSTGRPIVVDKDVRLPAWRMKVTAHARDAMGHHHGPPDFPLRGGVGIRVIFVLDRPRSHFGTGKNEDKIKASSPRYPANMPDIDKLLRAILDALTDAGVWKDDGQVVWVQTQKAYPDVWGVNGPGVHISLGAMK